MPTSDAFDVHGHATAAQIRHRADFSTLAPSPALCISTAKWSHATNVDEAKPCSIAFQVRVLTADSELELAMAINMD